MMRPAAPKTQTERRARGRGGNFSSNAGAGSRHPKRQHRLATGAAGGTRRGGKKDGSPVVSARRWTKRRAVFLFPTALVAGLSRAGQYLRDGGEVVVVVLGDEVGQVYDAHLPAEPRVERRDGRLFFGHGFEPADERESRGAEGREQGFEPRVVVPGLLGLAVLHVGRAQHREPARVVFQTPLVQLVQVKKVPGLLLYRPRAAALRREPFAREPARQFFEPRGRAAQPLDDAGEDPDRQVEVELALDPAHLFEQATPPRNLSAKVTRLRNGKR